MAQCELEIILDSDSIRFKPGETISGKVRVKTNKEVKCNGLSLTFGWHTHGRGNRAQNTYHEEVLFDGTWAANETIEYKFSFDTPPGFPTYHGNYINVDYQIYVTADIPWAFDPSAEQEIIVEHTEDSLLLPDMRYELHAWWNEDNPTADASNVLLKAKGQDITSLSDDDLETLRVQKISNAGSVSGGLFVGVGCVAVFGFAFTIFLFFIMSDAPLFIRLIFMLVPDIVLGFILFFMLRNFIAQKKIGVPIVHINPSIIVHRGAEVESTIELTPQSDVQINSIYLTLTGQEVAVSGSGTNKTTHKHVIHTNRNQFVSNDQLKAGETRKYKTSIALPEDAPLTFNASSNRINWEVEYHVDIPLWPDWVAKVPLLCLPAPVSRYINGEKDKGRVTAVSNKDADFFDQKSNQDEAMVAASSVAPTESVPAVPEELKILDLALKQLDECSFGSDRERVFADFDTHQFHFGLIVDSVSATSVTAEWGDQYQNGKTVEGRIANYAKSVLVVFENSLTEEVSNLEANDEVDCIVLLAGWDDLKQKPVFVTRFD